MTSNNSLQQVAKLHCGIDVDKAKRDELLSASPTEIFVNIQEYITYCAHDVSLTHNVFKRVFPLFRSACPNPVTMAGVLTMGSSFLPVNESWIEYVKLAEQKYRDLEKGVNGRLIELAERAKSLIITSVWREDPWLSQLDWTPKKPRKPREALSRDVGGPQI